MHIESESESESEHWAQYPIISALTRFCTMDGVRRGMLGETRPISMSQLEKGGGDFCLRLSFVEGTTRVGKVWLALGRNYILGIRGSGQGSSGGSRNGGCQ